MTNSPCPQSASSFETVSTVNTATSNNDSNSSSNNNNDCSNSQKTKQPTAQQKMNSIASRSTHSQPTSEEQLARQLVPKFASRAYHLPGNGIYADWTQYILNNHPVLGICCHHRLHPLKMRQRLVILLGSFAFGVAITNVIYLGFVSTERDSEEEVFAIRYSIENGGEGGGDGGADGEESSDVTPPMSYQTVSISSGLFALVTIGSGSHAIFDRFVWSLSACGCCRAGGAFECINCCRNVGQYLVVLIVVTVIVLATLIVVIRASLEEGQSELPVVHNQSIYWDEIFDLKVEAMQDFSFLKGYALEFVASLFFYYPIMETVLFSGILGCYRLPVLGGRPREVRNEMSLQRREDAKFKRRASAAQDTTASDVV